MSSSRARSLAAGRASTTRSPRQTTSHGPTTTELRIHLYFSGVGVTWYGTEGPDYGTADVWLDGAYQGEIDLYEPTQQEDRELWSDTSLDNDYHHVLIERTGDKNPSSCGTKLSLDRSHDRGRDPGGPGHCRPRHLERRTELVGPRVR